MKMNFESPRKNENLEKISVIESLKTGSYQKANLVLVLLGDKPGINLTIYVDNEKQIYEEEEKIRSLNLNCRKISQKIKNGRYVAEFLLAKNQEIVNELSGVDSSRDHEKYGTLMGYPKSAIKAFLEGNYLSIEEEKKLLMHYPKIVLHDFRLSKDNSREEIQTLSRWNDTLEKMAPHLYSQLKQ